MSIGCYHILSSNIMMSKEPKKRGGRGDCWNPLPMSSMCVPHVAPRSGLEPQRNMQHLKFKPPSAVSTIRKHTAIQSTANMIYYHPSVQEVILRLDSWCEYVFVCYWHTIACRLTEQATGSSDWGLFLFLFSTCQGLD